MQKIEINRETIHLCQFLKLADAVASGGQTKFLLEEKKIRLNGVIETAKRRQLRDGDIVEVEGIGSWQVIQQGE